MTEAPSPSEHERKLAEQAAQRAQEPRARLAHVRPSGKVLNVFLAAPDGTLHLIQADTADAPGLELLGADDRSRIAGAMLALHQRLQDGDRHAA